MLGAELMKKLGGGQSGGVDIRAETVISLTYCEYKLDNDGFAYQKKDNAGNPYVQVDSWISPQVGMSNFECRASLLDGPPPVTGNLSVWENLGTDCAWSVNDGDITAPAWTQLKIEIRLAATGSVLDSATISLRLKDIFD